MTSFSLSNDMYLFQFTSNWCRSNCVVCGIPLLAVLRLELWKSESENKPPLSSLRLNTQLLFADDQTHKYRKCLFYHIGFYTNSTAECRLVAYKNTNKYKYHNICTSNNSVNTSENILWPLQ